VVVKRIVLMIGILCVALAMVIDIAAVMRAVAVQETMTTMLTSRVYLTLLSFAGWIMIVGSLVLMLVEAFRHSRMTTGRTNGGISTAADSDVSSGSSD